MFRGKFVIDRYRQEPEEGPAAHGFGHLRATVGGALLFLVYAILVGVARISDSAWAFLLLAIDRTRLLEFHFNLIEKHAGSKEHKQNAEQHARDTKAFLNCVLIC